MSVSQILLDLKDVAEATFSADEFPFAFIASFDAPKATITKLRSGSFNKAPRPGDVLWKGKIYIRICAPGETVAGALEAMAAERVIAQHTPRFLLATDGTDVSGVDRRTSETFHDTLSSLERHFDLFLPLAGIERFEAAQENDADIKAAGLLAKFYDAILEHNPDWRSPAHKHALNLFVTRTLFCMFAEDTRIFTDGVFTRSLRELTREDGSDTRAFLISTFRAMNVPPEERGSLNTIEARFPYVNGGLFRETTDVPAFNRKARRFLLDACGLIWREINPDIFGSMIQAVVDETLRHDLGAHYTSVPNILSLIRPMFLDGLEEDFHAAHDDPRKLERLLVRISRIRVFDPACGSGNFLIISYRELRRLEMRIFQRLREIAPQFTLPMSQVQISNFYGIEYADFAAETAKLSLWIAEYQMNEEFRGVFGDAPPALPLRDSGRIQQGNATRMDWSQICPPRAGFETYLVGNPPYVGSTYQTDEQKEDMTHVFSPIARTYKNLDYVACWVAIATDYVRRHGGKAAFVTTNSICQGEQVQMLWPIVFGAGLEIGFARQAFKWKNNAAKNAGVTCIIVCVRPKSNDPKFLIDASHKRLVRNVSPYLIEMDNIIVEKRSRPLANVEKMEWGNKPSDGGFLILTPMERDALLQAHPEAERFLRRYFGTKEFIDGVVRWCIWVEDSDYDEANAIAGLRVRFEKVRAFRADSTAAETRVYSHVGHRFRQIQDYGKDALLITSTSSENRDYIPAGFLGSDVIISNLAYAVYDAPSYLFSIVSSKMHLAWARTIGGQLETRIRYTNTLVYNTFPIPDLSVNQKTALQERGWAIIEARENHPGMTISELYDPKSMPDDLRQAHDELDGVVEGIYRGRRFRDDAERLEHLFRLYVARTRKAAA